MFTPLDPFQGYVSPIRLTIAPEQWANRTWNVTSHGRDDCAKDENTLFTAFGTFEGDQYYMAKKNSIRAINLASTFKDKRLATKLTGVCVATPVKEFKKETFLDQVAAQFSITSEEVNVESYRACTDDDQVGTKPEDQKWLKFKPQALTGGTLVWWQIVEQMPSVNIGNLEVTMIDKLNNDAGTRNALMITGTAYWIEGYKVRNKLPDTACPRSIVRYFGVTMDVLPSEPYSPVSPVVWAVRNSLKNMNPIWASGRYAVDPVMHPLDGLRKLAETGDVTAMVDELAQRKAKDHLESYGAAHADPSHPAEVVKGLKVHFGFYARPGDYLTLATKLSRSNDRFYANTEMGAPLFDDQCNPLWGTDVPMDLWDAGTAKDQPFWANLHLGRDSRQLWGSSHHLGQIPLTQLIYKVPDEVIQHGNDTYPQGIDLLRVTIGHGLDVLLEPMVNSYSGANATVQVALPQAMDLGNELRIEFPQKWFGFNANNMPTTAHILAGMDDMVDYPKTVIDGNILKLQFSSPIVLSSRMVTIVLDNLVLPPVCGELEYRLTTHSCMNNDIHNAGKYIYRHCGPAIVNATGFPPNGMPRGCDACNSCVYDFTTHGDDWFTCWAPDGTSFLRVGPLPPKCADNPYSLPGYPYP
mmetsp:Transcript_14684/g.26082  ORF Transcript_14684/g.26082 Transcript_14684/m.26082 type:complete len:638 (-) Transcript_14684:509-2422(-)